MKNKFLFALLILLPAALAAPAVNEVMPNPLDESNEWVEIWSSDTINLSEWMIGDRHSNDTLECSDCMVSGFFVIIGGSGSVSAVNPSSAYFTTDDSKIGNGLSNSGDCVNFFGPDGSSSFCWNSTVEEESWALSDGIWASCGSATPGDVNACDVQSQPSEESMQTEEKQPEEDPPVLEEENIVLSERLVSDVYAGTTYKNLFRIEIQNKADCSDQDTVRVSFNVSGKGTLYTSSFERDIGCSGYAATGFWMPEATGRHTVCGMIDQTTSGDSDPSDSSVCWVINVLEAVTEADSMEEETAEQPTETDATPEEKQEETLPEPEPEEQRSEWVTSFSDAFMSMVRILYSIGLLIT